MEASKSTFVATRKQLDGHLDYEQRRPHGVYSSKIKVPKAMDIFGAPQGFVALTAPYWDPNNQKNKRDAYKGKQIQAKWPHSGEYFGKLEYAPAAYDDNSKSDKTRKYGFASGRPMTRDDLSSTIQVQRYRHQLEIESRNDKGANDIMIADAKRMATARGPKRPAEFGISTAIPKFEHAFDRGQYVQEFTAKNDPRSKGERNFGTLRPTSADVGEGCFQKMSLKTPEFGVKQGISGMGSKYARPSNTMKALLPIGL